MKRYFFSLILILTLVSCNEEQSVFKIGKRIVVRPNEVQTISPTDSIRGSCFDGFNGLLCAADSVLVFHLTDATGYCLRALDLRTNNTVDFLRIGRGPDEILMGYFSGNRKVAGRTLLDICAMNEGLLLSVDLEETLQAGQAVIADRMEILPFATASFVLGNEILSEVVNDIDIFSYKLYDRESQTISRTLLPFGMDEYYAYYQPLFSAPKKMRPDGTKLCMGMVFFDELNILDVRGDGHLSVSTSKKTKDIETLNHTLETGELGHRYYYTTLSVTQDNIFTLYYGDASIKNKGLSRTLVHVYSWDGQDYR